MHAACAYVPRLQGRIDASRIVALAKGEDNLGEESAVERLRAYFFHVCFHVVLDDRDLEALMYELWENYTQVCRTTPALSGRQTSQRRLATQEYRLSEMKAIALDCLKAHEKSRFVKDVSVQKAILGAALCRQDDASDKEKGKEMLHEFLGGIEDREAPEFRFMDDGFEYLDKMLQTVDPEYTPPETKKEDERLCSVSGCALA